MRAVRNFNCVNTNYIRSEHVMKFIFFFFIYECMAVLAFVEPFDKIYFI